MTKAKLGLIMFCQSYRHSAGLGSQAHSKTVYTTTVYNSIVQTNCCKHELISENQKQGVVELSHGRHVPGAHAPHT
jgi:hypothetical protein